MPKSDWRENFYKPSVYWMEFAGRNPKKAVISSNKTGEYQLYAYDLENKKEQKLTNESGGKVFGSISSTGKWFYYLKDTDGSEVGHIYRVGLDDKEPIDLSPNLPRYVASFVRTSADDAHCIWIAATEEDHVVYWLQTNTQPNEPLGIYKTTNYVGHHIISNNGAHICFYEEEYRDGETIHHVHVYNTVTSQLTTPEFTAYKQLEPIAFLGSSETMILATHTTHGFKEMVLLDVKQELAWDISLPEITGDLQPLWYNEKLDTILFCQDYRGKQALYTFDRKDAAIKKVPSNGTVISWYGSACLQDDGSIFAQWESAAQPACLAQINSIPATGVFPESTPANGHAPQWEEVWFYSDSGHNIQGWLLKPRESQKLLPYVISAHGGPHSVATESYSPEALMWLQSGYGFLAVNYSGSTSFGEKFRTSIRGKPGTLESLDMVAARKYLIDQQNADPQQILLTGWSWGGFITLLTLGLYPELWAAGIAGIPVADTIASYEDENAFLKALDRELFGGSPSEVPEIYTTASPLTYVEYIKAPVLVIHAKNDSRCPARQVENYVTAMRKAGKTIQTHWFDSGHLGHFSNPSVAISNFEVVLSFIAYLNK